MVENVGRKVVLIAALLVASALLLTIPDRPFPLGLDIAGGTRLVYRFDFEEARRTGAIGAAEQDADVLQETIEIIRKRIDATGVKEISLRRQGTDRIEVSLPDLSAVPAGSVRATLAAPVEATGTAPILLVEKPSDLTKFPGGGGVIGIGGERIRYSARVGSELQVEQRGWEGSEIARHEVGETVVLVSDDVIKNAIENLGDLRFFPLAQDSDFSSRGTDRASADQKLEAWLAKPENAGAAIDAYNALPPELGGPPKGILWFPYRVEQGQAIPPLAERQMIAVTEPPKPEWNFTGADLGFVGPGTDQSGFPAVRFAMKPESRIRFGDFTEAYVKKQLAIVLNDVVVTAPEIRSPLIGESIIEGRFGQAECEELVTVLRSGSLRIKPILDQQEVVGASIGDEYVRRNLWAGATALVLIMAYMIAYYRWLGVFSSIALLSNLLMLMGAMVALQGTLTLAGIGGIVLTVGMAVDANILIFERIREEQDKGHKPLQAAKEGFQNALSAIVDGNLTTLITAIILYKIGTGTIKGFAVTLSIGIITTMFSALVITRVLVHYQLQRGVDKWRMARWLADPSFKFMNKARIAFAISSVVILLGVGGFMVLDDKKKLGIDFLGGATVKVRTEQGMPTARMKELVARLPGELAGADVVALRGSNDESGNPREFRITFKTSPDVAGGEVHFEQEIRRGLADVLQRGPIEADVRTEGGTSTATLGLYFEGPHSEADVQSVLAECGIADPKAAHRGGLRDVFDVTGAVAPGRSADLVRADVQAGFAGKKDSLGRPYVLALPIPESSVIGAQVVGELRDSAIIALALSSLLIVLYIRVRFAEYSYGLAALAADLHDVLTTLGAIALLVAIPWIHVEMNLTMIAAFLTILGYSLNDTIVIFDRIRENRPRVKGTLSEIIDLSLNQTLARTIVTSGTVIASTVIILIFNFGTGNVLEGFAFAVTFGCISGSYSTIFIASPIFAWLERRGQQRDAGGVPASKTPTPSLQARA
jgi:SecD/SecF fusion protein